MRIGVLAQAAPFLPARDGFRLAVGNLIRELARDHELDLVTWAEAATPAQMEWLRSVCRTVYWLAPRNPGAWERVVNGAAMWGRGAPVFGRGEVARALAKASAGRGWDVLHVAGGYAASLAPAGMSMPVVAALHDAPGLHWREIARAAGGGERWRARARAALGARMQRGVAGRVAACAVVAAGDAADLAASAPGARIAVIPNGVDVEYFRRTTEMRDGAGVERGGADRAPILVFHGDLSYPPNVAAAEHLALEILPRLEGAGAEWRLRLVGARPVAAVERLAARRGVEVLANPGDLRPALGEARVYAAALRHGGGMKNKILEAMAMELPVVAYREAMAGIMATDGREVELADDAGGFARAVERARERPAEAAARGRAARALVARTYTWAGCARAYERLYVEVGGGAARAAEAAARAA